MTHPTLSWCRRPALQKYQPHSAPASTAVPLLESAYPLYGSQSCTHMHTYTHPRYDEGSVNLEIREACAKGMGDCKALINHVGDRPAHQKVGFVLFYIKTQSRFSKVTLCSLDAFRLSPILQSSAFFVWSSSSSNRV